MITLYLDGEVEEANVVTIADGVTTVSGVSVIEDFLTIRSDDGANVTTIAHVANFDNDNDANEMLFTANGGSLLLDEDVGLRVESGSTFTPGGNVNVGSAGINSTIAIVGTWNATGTETINLEGDWALSGTFNAANGTVIFDGPNSGISTLTGATTFYNLTSITGGRTLTFPASTTTTVSNTLTLEGASNSDLLLRSSSAGTPGKGAKARPGGVFLVPLGRRRPIAALRVPGLELLAAMQCPQVHREVAIIDFAGAKRSRARLFLAHPSLQSFRSAPIRGRVGGPPPKPPVEAPGEVV